MKAKFPDGVYEAVITKLLREYSFEEDPDDSEHLKMSGGPLYDDQLGIKWHREAGSSSRKVVLRRTTSKADPNVIFFSLYGTSKKRDEQNKSKIPIMDIIKSIKGSGPYKIKDEDYQRILTDAAAVLIRGLEKEGIKLSEIDLIITPQSGSSLVTDLVKSITERLSGMEISIESVGDLIQKETDPNLVRMKPLPAKTSKKSIVDIARKIRKWREEGHVNMKDLSGYSGRFRKYLINHLFIDMKYKDMIRDKSILIIDDILTSGSTLEESAAILRDFGARKVVGLTLIKHYPR